MGTSTLKRILFEIKPIITLVLALITYFFVIGFGIFHNLIKSLIESLQFRFWRGIWHFTRYWLMMFYQCWSTVRYFINKISVSIDLLGNVGAGELMEDAVTVREHTWFGNGRITISASIGKEKADGKLTKFGQFVDYVLSFVFEKNHCENAYDKKKLIDDFNDQRGVEFDTE